MATATTNAYADGSSLTNFNAWAYWMYQQFLAFGWTQTADSGQGTFPASGSVPSAAGYYAVFQSADGLSSATKITVKIEFWADGSSIPNFGLTIGTNGTDGAGNLLTPYSTRIYGGGGTYNFKCQSASTTNLLPCYASGDSGSIRFCMWNAGVSSPDEYNIVYIIIARSRDGSGNATSNYVQLWAGSYNGKFFQTVFGSNGGSTIMDTNNYVMAAYPNYSGSASWSSGGAILASPIVQNIGGLSNPTPDLLLGSNKDFVPAATAAITVYGVSHTYLACSSGQFYQFVNGPYSSLLMRYE